VTARPQRLVLLGGGGLARETAEAVRAANAQAAVWELLGILDDNPALKGGSVGGLPVLGPTDLVADLEPDVQVLATVASSAEPIRRTRLVERLALPPQRWATVVHPAAHLATSTALGPGCIVLAGVVATADATLGDHVVVMPNCVLTHDDVLSDGCTLASGVLLSGSVRVGRDAYLGTGSMVREGLQIGRRAVVGMGAVVTKDVPDGETWIGVPARPRPVMMASG
jgi:sugar O-acyltransferase (sialic acid O-acetyltransferase NeuD family)